jgi:hypothetical protein
MRFIPETHATTDQIVAMLQKMFDAVDVHAAKQVQPPRPVLYRFPGWASVPIRTGTDN